MAVNLWAFAAVAVPLVASPGPSTALVLRNSIAGGARSGVAAAVGANTGSLCYGLLTAFGVSAALHRWPSVWTALRVGGGAYLVWLGSRSILRAWSGRPASPLARVPGGDALLARSAREGFVTNVLNPSLATFYLLILPQFIPKDVPFAAAALTLTAIHIGLAITWHLTWATAGGALADTLGRSRPRRVLEGLTGATLLGFAVKVALSP